MKEQENCLIAEFMGMVRSPFNPNQYSFSEDVVDGISGRWRTLKYDTSWEWLMRVVQKIDKLYNDTFPGNEEFIRRILAKEEPLDGPYMEVCALPLATPIEEAHKAVVEFIKWYNQQK